VKLIVEAQVEDRAPFKLEVVPDAAKLMKALQEQCGFAEQLYVFERDADEPIGDGIAAKKAIDVVAHRCKRISVTVRFEHKQFVREFSPAATSQRVLHWAVGKQAFNLDGDARSKANLILPGGEQPLPGDTTLAGYAKFPACSLVLDLTLKDFTNG
jgi:hypothetical protein